MNKKTKNRILLVEGNDDKHVILALCEKFNLPETFDIIDCKGIDKLLEQIHVRFLQSEIETIGIVIDADSDIKNRWKTLKAILILQGFDLPNKLPLNGLVVSNKNNIKIGVWIMPNNQLDGMLENFISFLIPQDDKLLPIVHSTLDAIENQKLNKYSLKHKPKAIIHSWLSWQENPGTPMGLGITKRYLTTDEKTCNTFIDWLTRLFT